MTPFSDERVLLDLVLEHRKLKDAGDFYAAGYTDAQHQKQVQRLSGMIRRRARKMLKTQKGPEADARQLSIMDIEGVCDED